MIKCETAVCAQKNKQKTPLDVLVASCSESNWPPGDASIQCVHQTAKKQDAHRKLAASFSLLIQRYKGQTGGNSLSRKEEHGENITLGFLFRRLNNRTLR